MIRCLILMMMLTSIATGATFAQQTQQNEPRGIVTAAEHANWSLVNQRLDENADANDTQPDGMTTLHWAVFHENEQLVKRLIESDADVNALTRYHVSPLSLACEMGAEAIVELLLAAGADVESKRLGGERPLMIAARLGNDSIIGALIRNSAEIDANEAGRQTALMWAAAEGNVAVVEKLIEHGASWKLRTKNGFTGFFFAARNGHSEVVACLLEAGADVNSIMNPPNSGGRKPRKSTSALMLAVESAHFELALELIGNGADPNDQRSGFAPLHALSWVRKTKRGDNPDGDPPPRGSGAIKSTEFVREIVNAGANVNLALVDGKAGGTAQLNPQGATPFLLAASTADLPLMKLLVELGADPTITNVDGCTPLMAAAGVGVVAVGEEPGTEEEVNAAIEYLTGLGLDPNVVDKNGETAMHGAAYRNFPQAVKLLADMGADPAIWNRKNRHNWTPHRIATGYRPGSFKPSPATLKALDEAMTPAD